MTTQKEIDTRNAVNAATMETHDKLKAIFAPYVGKKVRKVEPEFTRKIKDEIAPICEDLRKNGFRIWFKFAEHTIYCEMDKTFPWSEYSVQYVKKSFRLCTLAGDSLKEFGNRPVLRANYTLEEVKAGEGIIRSLEMELCRAKDSIAEFLNY
jgi:hypothetical protein